MFPPLSLMTVTVILLEVTPVTAPMPGLMLTLSSPLRLRLNTLDPSGGILPGCAVKEPVGRLGGVTSGVASGEEVDRLRFAGRPGFTRQVGLTQVRIAHLAGKTPR